MNYLEIFPYIGVLWGTITLLCLRFGESSPKQYNGMAVVLLVCAWFYLFACAPLFKEGQMAPDFMHGYIGLVALLLSVEVWFIFISTMLAIGIAKTAHDPSHHSYLVGWHSSIRTFFKPVWPIVAVANIANATYYLFAW